MGMSSCINVQPFLPTAYQARPSSTNVCHPLHGHKQSWPWLWLSFFVGLEAHLACVSVHVTLISVDEHLLCLLADTHAAIVVPSREGHAALTQYYWRCVRLWKTSSVIYSCIICTVVSYCNVLKSASRMKLMESISMNNKYNTRRESASRCRISGLPLLCFKGSLKQYLTQHRGTKYYPGGRNASYLGTAPPFNLLHLA